MHTANTCGTKNWRTMTPKATHLMQEEHIFVTALKITASGHLRALEFERQVTVSSTSAAASVMTVSKDYNGGHFRGGTFILTS